MRIPKGAANQRTLVSEDYFGPARPLYVSYPVVTRFRAPSTSSHRRRETVITRDA
jgi:hypothetical protein